MKAFSLLVLLALCGSGLYAADTNDSLLNVLKTELSKQSSYDQQKEIRIKKLKRQAVALPASNYQARYIIYSRIYEEYKAYEFDSAYVYTQKLFGISKALNDAQKIAETKIKLSFILLSAGMFKETFDCLNEINPNLLKNDSKPEFYALKARAYSDLADYDNGNHYTKINNAIAVKYLDSAIASARPGSYEQLINLGGRQIRMGQTQSLSKWYVQLLYHYPLTAHQRAIVATNLSYFYNKPQNRQQRIALLATAAINDIRSSTKETLAIFKLGQEIYMQGNVIEAYNYIQQGMDNALYYGARLRTIKIGAVLPIVAAKKLILVENEKKQFLLYLLLSIAIALIIALISFIIFYQLRQMQAKEKVIADKNLQLEGINDRLTEDTRIKEEYIGNFFNTISEYILKLEKLKRSIERKLVTKKYDEIPVTINEINIKGEREKLYYTFDHIFIKIFPNFISVFNSLLKEEDQIWPKDNEVLNTDLRIFALMRLGIQDNQTIANILEYSVNTIYVYKMRIKAKALVPGDQFDQKIMTVKAVEAP